MVVWLCHARVGHRQGLYPKRQSSNGLAFFFARRAAARSPPPRASRPGFVPGARRAARPIQSATTTPAGEGLARLERRAGSRPATARRPTLRHSPEPASGALESRPRWVDFSFCDRGHVRPRYPCRHRLFRAVGSRIAAYSICNQFLNNGPQGLVKESFDEYSPTTPGSGL